MRVEVRCEVNGLGKVQFIHEFILVNLAAVRDDPDAFTYDYVNFKQN